MRLVPYPLNLLAIAAAGTLIGFVVSRWAPFTLRRGLRAVAVIAPLALVLHVPPEQVLIYVLAMVVGVFWARGAPALDAAASTPVARAMPQAAVAVRPAPASPAANGIAERRQQEMGQLRAQRRGRKSPIF